MCHRNVLRGGMLISFAVGVFVGFALESLWWAAFIGVGAICLGIKTLK